MNQPDSASPHEPAADPKQTNTTRCLDILIDPGHADREAIRFLFEAISELNRAFAGNGVKYAQLSPTGSNAAQTMTSAADENISPHFDRYRVTAAELDQQAEGAGEAAFIRTIVTLAAGFYTKSDNSLLKPTIRTLESLLKRIRFTDAQNGGWQVSFKPADMPSDQERSREYILALPLLAEAVDRIRRLGGDIALARPSLQTTFAAAAIDMAALDKFLTTEFEGVVDVVNARTVYQQVRKNDSLPVAPDNVLKIIRLAGDEQAGLDELEPLVEQDPVLAGRILQYVNSGFFGLKHVVTSLRQALSLLGATQVTMIALGLALRSVPKPVCTSFDYDRFWLQSSARAVAARRMASLTGDSDPEEAFAAGLLCQIGQLALASVFPDQYAKVLDQSSVDESDWLREAERAAFGLDHAELATAMLRDWGMAKSFCLAVQHQSNPQDIARNLRAHILANILNWSASMSTVLNWTGPRQNSNSLRKVHHLSGRLGVPETGFVDLYNNTIKDWQDLGTVLDFEAPNVASWQETRVEQ